MDLALVNWPAVIAGTIAAYVLGMVWFSPIMFGKSWAQGTHNIQPPASPPILAMIVQFVGIALLAIIVGITETSQAIVAAIVAIFAVALNIAGMDLFSQKSGRATLIDAGYIVASGVLMVLAQALL